MNAFEAITADILAIDAETERISKREGFESSHTCTGKVMIDPNVDAVWYEMADERNTTTWVSRSFPERAAWDETLVVVDSPKDALDFPFEDE